ncbi:MAG: hypothetical protein LC105_07955 [Chitinophagales bacterium]|nr:hypothetical protein [Chitinophagales bacterium]MCZ2393772.1 hypothetical protein [Chitinophagales bacterium]
MQKIVKIFFIATILILAFNTSCKKEKPTEPIPESYLGRFAVSSPGFDYKYIEIVKDTIYFYTESGNYKLRSKKSFIYTVSGDSIIKYQFGPSYTFSINNGTLTLGGTPYFNKTLTAERSNSVPFANQWVKPVYVDSIGAINSGSPSVTPRYDDLASYFGKVITEPHYNGSSYVFKTLTVDNNNSYTATEIPVDPLYKSQVGYEDNIEFFNNKILVYNWGNPNSYLYSINPSTGKVENTILVANPVGNIYDLASDGTSLFGLTYTGIRKFDFLNNQWEYEFATGGTGSLSGLKGYLYFSIGNSTFLQKANSSTLLVEDAYEIPDNYSIEGTAFLNDFTLLACLYNYNTTSYGIYLIYLY